MKYILLSSVLLILFSCHKDDPLSDLPDGTIEYKINDTLVTIHANTPGQESTACSRITDDSATAHISGYSFYGQLLPYNILYFIIPVDSLRTQSYTVDSTGSSRFGTMAAVVSGNKESSIYLYSDHLSVHISSYANGLISGTFSGDLSPNGLIVSSKLRGSTKIREGKFKNIQCFY